MPVQPPPLESPAGLPTVQTSPAGAGPASPLPVRIGNQTAFSAESFTRPFEYAVAHGFDAFEWFPDKKPFRGWDDQDLDPAARAAIAKTARALGMRLSVHARLQANPLRAESRALFARDIALAVDLGASLLNIHLQPEEGIPAYLEAIRPLIAATTEAGLQLSIENCASHTPAQVNALFELLRGDRTLAAAQVGMCFDLGHANLSPETRNDYLRFLRALDASVPIIHLHLHENRGDYDSHLPLFTGPAGENDRGLRGFVRELRARRFSGSVILEVWPQDRLLLNQARDRLLGLWREGAGR